MICLDYQTYNRRWGQRGMRFQSWQSYSFVLGYLSNIVHYVNTPQASRSASISIRIESNDDQGAWEKEERIYYYGDLDVLQAVFFDLYDHSSAGVGSVTRRINSNGYVASLVDDFGFDVVVRPGYSTEFVFPSDPDGIYDCLRRHLISEQLTNNEIDDCLNWFDKGFNMQ